MIGDPLMVLSCAITCGACGAVHRAELDVKNGLMLPDTWALLRAFVPPPAALVEEEAEEVDIEALMAGFATGMMKRVGMGDSPSVTEARAALERQRAADAAERRAKARRPRQVAVALCPDCQTGPAFLAINKKFMAAAGVRDDFASTITRALRDAPGLEDQDLDDLMQD